MQSTSLRGFIFHSGSFCTALALLITALAFSAPGFAQVSFQAPSVHTSPNIPNDIFIADLNGDGRPDIVTTQAGSNMVSVFLNNNGTFPAGPSATYLTGSGGVNNVVVADFDEDGSEDIATANCGNSPDPPQQPIPSTVSILFGAGGGTFKNHVDYPLPACPDSIGFLTVVNTSIRSLVVSYSGSDITLLRNDSFGTFSEHKIVGPAGSNLRGVSAADYNGDGLDDVAAVMSLPGTTIQQVVIFYEKPDGSFGPATPIFSKDAFLVAANTVGFNRSGRPDLLVPFTAVPGVNQPSGVIALTNNGGGSFSALQLSVDHRYNPGSKAAEGDLQGNGLHSIILPLTTGNAGNQIVSAFAVFLHQSNGGFLGPIYFAGDVTGSSRAVAVADFNGDKRLDFAAAGGEDNHLLIYQNTTTASSCPFFLGGIGGVNICMPTAGSTVGSPIAIGASGSGGTLPIVAMKAYLNGSQVVLTDTNTINAFVAKAAGNYQLAVNAWDINDKVYQTIVNFTVGTSTACSAPSTAGVHICKPVSGSTVSSPVAISAAANGGTSRITAMKAYIDGKQVAASTSGSLSGSAAEATGAHKLTVNAWNSAGKLFQSIITFSVK